MKNKLKLPIAVSTVLVASICFSAEPDKENKISAITPPSTFSLEASDKNVSKSDTPFFSSDKNIPKLSQYIKEEMKRAINSYERTGRYEFPIKPGTSAWQELTTKKQMLEVSQIPDYILASLSSRDLLALIIKHPLALDHFAYNDIEAGFSAFIASFNGVKIFLKRPDASKILLEEYAKLSSQKEYHGTVITSDLITKPIFKMGIIELLMSQDIILDELKKDKSFGKWISPKIRSKLKQNTDFKFYSLSTSKVLLANYLMKTKVLSPTKSQLPSQKTRKLILSLDESVNWLISMTEK